MMDLIAHLITPFVFLAVVVLILLLTILTQPSSSEQPTLEGCPQNELKATDILQWEFEYIRTTASEAMRDRHTMINFYLLAVGIVLCFFFFHNLSYSRLLK